MSDYLATVARFKEERMALLREQREVRRLAVDDLLAPLSVVERGRLLDECRVLLPGSLDRMVMAAQRRGSEVLSGDGGRSQTDHAAPQDRHGTDPLPGLVEGA